MGLEEQEEEREVLASIFPDEIKDIAENEFRVSILLEVTNDEDDDSEPPTILLNVKYPEAYPDEAPQLDLYPVPGAAPHPYFNLSEDKAHLLQPLETTIEDSMGMAMIYSIISALKETAEELIANRQASKAAAKEAEAQEEERKENEKFQGTPVTPESFLKWRAAFLAEMQEERRRREEEEAAERKKKGVKESEKLTGKQIWEKGLAGKIDEEDEGEDALADATAKLDVAS